MAEYNPETHPELLGPYLKGDILYKKFEGGDFAQIHELPLNEEFLTKEISIRELAKDAITVEQFEQQCALFKKHLHAFIPDFYISYELDDSGKNVEKINMVMQKVRELKPSPKSNQDSPEFQKFVSELDTFIESSWELYNDTYNEGQNAGLVPDLSVTPEWEPKNFIYGNLGEGQDSQLYFIDLFPAWRGQRTNDFATHIRTLLNVYRTAYSFPKAMQVIKKIDALEEIYYQKYINNTNKKAAKQ
jgi:hypothetical protein